jgi:hypothetical protein
VSEGHPPTVGYKAGYKSGHQNKLREQGALTPCRGRRQEQVRTQNETEGARGTHALLDTEEEIIQDKERDRGSKGALTVCQTQREGYIRTPTKPRERGTHALSSTEGGTSQVTKGN